MASNPHRISASPSSRSLSTPPPPPPSLVCFRPARVHVSCTDHMRVQITCSVHVQACMCTDHRPHVYRSHARSTHACSQREVRVLCCYSTHACTLAACCAHANIPVCSLRAGGQLYLAPRDIRVHRVQPLSCDCRRGRFVCRVRASCSCVMFVRLVVLRACPRAPASLRT